jgi:hypothetical protein
VAPDRDSDADQYGTEGHPEKKRRHLAGGFVRALGDLVEQREDHDRGAVVNQALALDDVP